MIKSSLESLRTIFSEIRPLKFVAKSRGKIKVNLIKSKFIRKLENKGSFWHCSFYGDEKEIGNVCDSMKFVG